MKLNVSGNINHYYVQTLCMIFFPGEKFSEGTDTISDGIAVPEISLSLFFDTVMKIRVPHCQLRQENGDARQ